MQYTAWLNMKRAQPPNDVPERHETVRRALRDALRTEQPLTALDLSAQLHISESDVFAHLEHIIHSLSRTGERVHVEPARCLACGFIFQARSRLKKPGRCPGCRATRIAPPSFCIVAS